MNDDVRIKRNNYNVHEHVVSPPPPPNVRNNVKSIGMRNGSKTKQFAIVASSEMSEVRSVAPDCGFYCRPKIAPPV